MIHSFPSAKFATDFVKIALEAPRLISVHRVEQPILDLWSEMNVFVWINTIIKDK